MIKITTCPSCGSERIKKVRRTWEGDYHGRACTAENLQCYECPDCGEKVDDPQAMRIIEALAGRRLRPLPVGRPRKKARNR